MWPEGCTNLLGDPPIAGLVHGLETQTERGSGVGRAGMEPAVGQMDAGPVAAIDLGVRESLSEPVTEAQLGRDRPCVDLRHLISQRRSCLGQVLQQRASSVDAVVDPGRMLASRYSGPNMMCPLVSPPNAICCSRISRRKNE